jgi:hypothetical protein
LSWCVTKHSTLQKWPPTIRTNNARKETKRNPSWLVVVRVAPRIGPLVQFIQKPVYMDDSAIADDSRLN